MARPYKALVSKLPGSKPSVPKSPVGKPISTKWPPIKPSPPKSPAAPKSPITKPITPKSTTSRLPALKSGGLVRSSLPSVSFTSNNGKPHHKILQAQPLQPQPEPQPPPVLSDEALNLHLVRGSTLLFGERLKEDICRILKENSVKATDLLWSCEDERVIELFPDSELQYSVLEWRRAYFEDWKWEKLGDKAHILIQAVAEGNIFTVKKVLNDPDVPPAGRKLLVEQKNENHDDLLCQAASLGELDIVRFLVNDVGANIETRGNLGRTPLLRASCFGRKGSNLRFLAIIKFLVQKGAFLEAVDIELGAKAIHLAARYGDPDSVDYFLSLRKDWLEVQDRKTGRTPLLHAAAGGSLAVLNYLVQRGANLEAEDNDSGMQAIHLAAQYGQVDAVSYLLTLNDEWLETEDSENGMTPFLHACANGNVAVAKLLAQRGADIEAEDDDGLMAIHLAASFGNADTITYLLSLNKSFLNATNSDEQTPLACARLNENEETIEFLLQQGAK